jgi:hypothetical protein
MSTVVHVVELRFVVKHPEYVELPVPEIPPASPPSPAVGALPTVFCPPPPPPPATTTMHGDVAAVTPDAEQRGLEGSHRTVVSDPGA